MKTTNSQTGFVIKALNIIIFLSAFTTQELLAQKSVSASPYPIEIVQPDNTKLLIVGKGSRAIHHTQTADGYTIVKNSIGVYEYAIRTVSGELVPSGFKARNASLRTKAEKTFLQKIETDLRESEIILNQKKSSALQKSSPTVPMKSFPAKGTRKALLILIKYPDLGNTNTLTDFNNLMNLPNYNSTGSFKDYFSSNSFGQLNVTTDVFGWYTASHNFSYYGEQNGSDVARELVREAIDAAEAAGVNFSQYDNDSDGAVDGVIIIHAGPGAEEGSQLQYIWSHRWSLGPYERTYDGKLISDYMINPERRSFGMVGIGVICHEFGHGMGLPDLYDTDGGSEGVGEWCLMGGGGWLNFERTPGNLSAWAKIQLGWQNPLVISSGGSYSLAPSNSSNTSYKLTTPVAGEYFLLENRQKTGFDAYLPGEGLAVWHVNENSFSNSDEDSKFLDLEEADGSNDLDYEVNRGDDGDLYPGTSGNPAFNFYSNPSSRNYNGNNSGISVSCAEEIQGVVDNVSFNLGIQACPYCAELSTIVECTGSISDGSGPNNYFNNSNCQWLISPEGASSLTLTFTAFQTESGNDFVTVYDGSTTSSTVLGTFSGNTIPGNITSSGGSLLVVFNTNNTSAFGGWSAQFSATDCGPFCDEQSVLTECSGIFTDGSGLKDYKNKKSCEWLIQPFSANSITLSFSEFNVEDSFDYVTVYDENGFVLGEFTGSNIPGDITHNGSLLWVVFTSDNSISAPGWTASYTSVGCVPAYCDEITTLTDCFGSFSDGSGLENYQNSLQCKWLIEPQNASSITLSFSEFNTENTWDVVTIYDGKTTSDPQLASFSGSGLPSDVTSTGGSMLVLFSTDFSVTAGGWAANYTANDCNECDQLIISLSTGWNMISSNINSENPNMESVFAEIESEIIIVKNNIGQSYIPSFNFNGIGNWDITQGYQVKTSSNPALTIGCTAADPTTPISLNQGWNMIGYLLSSPINIEAALAGINSNIVIVKNNAGQSYIPSFGINSIGNMQLGQGYQIKMINNATLVYPSARQSYSENFTPSASLAHFQSPQNTGSNATIIFPKGALANISDADEISVHTSNGIIAGAAVATENAFAVTVWADDASTQDITEGFKENETFYFTYYSKATGIEQPLQISFAEGNDFFIANGISIVNSQKTAGVYGVKNSGFKFYPNPTTGHVHLEFQLKNSSEVKIKILNIAGKEIFTVHSELAAGSQVQLIDLSQYPQGQYIIEIIADDDVMREKVALVK